MKVRDNQNSKSSIIGRHSSTRTSTRTTTSTIRG